MSRKISAQEWRAEMANGLRLWIVANRITESHRIYDHLLDDLKLRSVLGMTEIPLIVSRLLTDCGRPAISRLPDDFNMWSDADKVKVAKAVLAATQLTATSGKIGAEQRVTEAKKLENRINHMEYNIRGIKQYLDDIPTGGFRNQIGAIVNEVLNRHGRLLYWFPPTWTDRTTEMRKSVAKELFAAVRAPALATELSQRITNVTTSREFEDHFHSLTGLLTNDEKKIVVNTPPPGGDDRPALLQVAANPNFMQGAFSNLIQAGADVNAVDSNGNTPLLLVAKGDMSESDCKRAAEMLLLNGADPSKTNKAGKDAGNFRLEFRPFQELLKRAQLYGKILGATADNADTVAGDIKAIVANFRRAHGKDSTQRMLHIIPPGARGNHNLLQTAVYRKPYREVVQALVESGADPTVASSTTRESLLHLVAHLPDDEGDLDANIETAEYLTSHGINMSMKNREGITALQIAESYNPGVAEILRNHRAAGGGGAAVQRVPSSEPPTAAKKFALRNRPKSAEKIIAEGTEKQFATAKLLKEAENINAERAGTKPFSGAVALTSDANPFSGDVRSAESTGSNTPSPIPEGPPSTGESGSAASTTPTRGTPSPPAIGPPLVIAQSDNVGHLGDAEKARLVDSTPEDLWSPLKYHSNPEADTESVFSGNVDEGALSEPEPEDAKSSLWDIRGSQTLAPSWVRPRESESLAAWQTAAEKELPPPPPPPAARPSNVMKYPGDEAVHRVYQRVVQHALDPKKRGCPSTLAPIVVSARACLLEAVDENLLSMRNLAKDDTVNADDAFNMLSPGDDGLEDVCGGYFPVRLLPCDHDGIVREAWNKGGRPCLPPAAAALPSPARAFDGLQRLIEDPAERKEAIERGKEIFGHHNVMPGIAAFLGCKDTGIAQEIAKQACARAFPPGSGSDPDDEDDWANNWVEACMGSFDAEDPEAFIEALAVAWRTQTDAAADAGAAADKRVAVPDMSGVPPALIDHTLPDYLIGTVHPMPDARLRCKLTKENGAYRVLGATGLSVDFGASADAYGSCGGNTVQAGDLLLLLPDDGGGPPTVASIAAAVVGGRRVLVARRGGPPALTAYTGRRPGAGRPTTSNGVTPQTLFNFPEGALRVDPGGSMEVTTPGAPYAVNDSSTVQSHRLTLRLLHPRRHPAQPSRQDPSPERPTPGRRPPATNLRPVGHPTVAQEIPETASADIIQSQLSTKFGAMQDELVQLKQRLALFSKQYGENLALRDDEIGKLRTKISALEAMLRDMTASLQKGEATIDRLFALSDNFLKKVEHSNNEITRLQSAVDAAEARANSAGVAAAQALAAERVATKTVTGVLQARKPNLTVALEHARAENAKLEDEFAVLANGKEEQLKHVRAESASAIAKVIADGEKKSLALSMEIARLTGELKASAAKATQLEATKTDTAASEGRLVAELATKAEQNKELHEALKEFERVSQSDTDELTRIHESQRLLGREIQQVQRALARSEDEVSTLIAAAVPGAGAIDSPGGVVLPSPGVEDAVRAIRTMNYENEQCHAAIAQLRSNSAQRLEAAQSDVEAAKARSTELTAALSSALFPLGISPALYGTLNHAHQEKLVYQHFAGKKMGDAKAMTKSDSLRNTLQLLEKTNPAARVYQSWVSAYVYTPPKEKALPEQTVYIKRGKRPFNDAFLTSTSASTSEKGDSGFQLPENPIVGFIPIYKKGHGRGASRKVAPVSGSPAGHTPGALPPETRAFGHVGPWTLNGYIEKAGRNASKIFHGDITESDAAALLQAGAKPREGKFLLRSTGPNTVYASAFLKGSIKHFGPFTQNELGMFYDKKRPTGASTLDDLAGYVEGAKFGGVPAVPEIYSGNPLAFNLGQMPRGIQSGLERCWDDKQCLGVYISRLLVNDRVFYGWHPAQGHDQSTTGSTEDGSAMTIDKSQLVKCTTVIEQFQQYGLLKRLVSTPAKENWTRQGGWTLRDDPGLAAIPEAESLLKRQKKECVEDVFNHDNISAKSCEELAYGGEQAKFKEGNGREIKTRSDENVAAFEENFHSLCVAPYVHAVHKRIPRDQATFKITKVEIVEHMYDLVDAKQPTQKRSFWRRRQSMSPRKANTLPTASAIAMTPGGVGRVRRRPSSPVGGGTSNLEGSPDQGLASIFEEGSDGLSEDDSDVFSRSVTVGAGGAESPPWNDFSTPFKRTGDHLGYESSSLSVQAASRRARHRGPDDLPTETVSRGHTYLDLEDEIVEASEAPWLHQRLRSSKVAALDHAATSPASPAYTLGALKHVDVGSGTMHDDPQPDVGDPSAPPPRAKPPRSKNHTVEVKITPANGKVNTAKFTGEPKKTDKGLQLNFSKLTPAKGPYEDVTKVRLVIRSSRITTFEKSYDISIEDSNAPDLEWTEKRAVYLKKILPYYQGSINSFTLQITCRRPPPAVAGGARPE